MSGSLAPCPLPSRIGSPPAVPSRYEQSSLAVFPSSVEGSRAAAPEVAALIRGHRKEGRGVVLGLATGSTPLSLYAELVRLHREEGLSFASVTTFNLDEYYPLAPSHAQSYRHFMQVHLFDHLDIPPHQTHVPDGTVAAGAVDRSCQEYEERIRSAGGVDFQILGIGRTGHIGFNEPGSARRSRTRLVTLDPLTRRDAAGDFGGEENTPRYAITMGVRTIMEARRIVLMAWGQHKAEIVRIALEGPVTPHVTASFLQEHDQAEFILDHAAAGALTRFRTPWLLGPLEDQALAWDERTTRRAILWLSQTRAKPILKLTDDDYNEAGLQDLLAVKGSAYAANLDGFYQLQHTITGWPGGRDPRRTKPGDAPVRPAAGAVPPRCFRNASWYSPRIRTTMSSRWAERSAAWWSMGMRSISPTRYRGPTRFRMSRSGAPCGSPPTPASATRPRDRAAALAVRAVRGLRARCRTRRNSRAGRGWCGGRRRSRRRAFAGFRPSACIFSTCPSTAAGAVAGSWATPTSHG